MKPKAEQILKVDEVGRVWTPRELREAALDEFERSGMPATQFAGQIGVKYPTFASWVQKRRREHGGRKRCKGKGVRRQILTVDNAGGLGNGVRRQILTVDAASRSC